MERARDAAADLLDRLRAVNPPWYVMALALLAVGVLPGGIPLTTLLAPVYIRRRLRQPRPPQALAAGRPLTA